MKVIMIEATAEELRANRTVLDTLTDALSGFAQNLVGVNLSKDAVAKYLKDMSENDEECPITDNSEE